MRLAFFVAILILALLGMAFEAVRELLGRVVGYVCLFGFKILDPVLGRVFGDDEDEQWASG